MTYFAVPHICLMLTESRLVSRTSPSTPMLRTQSRRLLMPSRMTRMNQTMTTS